MPLRSVNSFNKKRKYQHLMYKSTYVSQCLSLLPPPLSFSFPLSLPLPPSLPLSLSPSISLPSFPSLPLALYFLPPPSLSSPSLSLASSPFLLLSIAVSPFVCLSLSHALSLSISLPHFSVFGGSRYRGEHGRDFVQFLVGLFSSFAWCQQINWVRW